jgi:hypothetical protein
MEGARNGMKSFNKWARGERKWCRTVVRATGQGIICGTTKDQTMRLISIRSRGSVTTT